MSRVLPIEIGYFIEHHQNGFDFITPRAAQLKRDEEVQRFIPENPIRIARMYFQERGGNQPKTYEQIARKFGVSKVEVCYHMALINRLPAEFVTWLENSDEQEVLKLFTERRLRPIARLDARDKQLSVINDICVHLPNSFSS